MSSLAAKFEPVFMAKKIWFEDAFICLELTDGREIKTPLEFYPKLNTASQSQRENYELIGQGTGAHWKDLDEDLSIEGIVLGRPSFNR